MHRTVKELLELLVFSCPLCKDVKRTYNEINKHLQSCNGLNSDENSKVAIEKFNKVEVTNNQKQQINYTELLIYIMEKDSKKFYIYNSKT